MTYPTAGCHCGSVKAGHHLLLGLAQGTPGWGSDVKFQLRFLRNDVWSGSTVGYNPFKLITFKLV